MARRAQGGADAAVAPTSMGEETLKFSEIVIKTGEMPRLREYRPETEHGTLTTA